MEQEALPTGHPCVWGSGLGAAGLAYEFSYQNPKHASGHLLFACPLPWKGGHRPALGQTCKCDTKGETARRLRTFLVLSTPNITIL